MIEKIKDILYDLSDIVVSLIIIAVIFVSVSWKISDTLDVNLKETLANPTVEAEVDPPVTVIIPEINPNGISDEATDPTSENSNPTDSTGDSSENTPEPAADTTPPSDATPSTPSEPETNSTPSGALISFEVPEGATGYSIGKKLVSEGYVDDVDTFVNRLVALKLDNKLRAGTFELSKSDSLDVIIKVLAGQGR